MPFPKTLVVVTSIIESKIAYAVAVVYSLKGGLLNADASASEGGVKLPRGVA